MTVRTEPVPKNTEPDTRAARITKKVRLIARLSTKKGASINTLCSKFGWQAHTARAALSGLRTAGHIIERTPGKNGSIYRIVDRPST